MKLHRHVSSVETDAGMVLLDERRGRYFQLNRTASHMLRELLNGVSPEDTTAEISRKYSMSREDVASDMRSVIEKLRSEKLVET